MGALRDEHERDRADEDAAAERDDRPVEVVMR
jgi:hypothetical protein